MTRDHILGEIHRTASANGSAPLGWRRFESETGIRLADWSKHWARWAEAIQEAGYTPNGFIAAFDDSALLERYATLCRQLGRIPAISDLKLKAHQDDTFPSEKTFRRFKTKDQLVSRLADFCRAVTGWNDVLAMCDEYKPTVRVHTAEQPADGKQIDDTGFVYQMRSGRYFKIGRTNAAGRRERELAIQLPEKLATVHVIRTDDPAGIEDYWHRRFADKRKNGEWFDLTAADVAAFKRRKFM